MEHHIVLTQATQLNLLTQYNMAPLKSHRLNVRVISTLLRRSSH